MKNLILLVSAAAAVNAWAMTPPGHYTGRCDVAMVTHYSKSSGMKPPTQVGKYYYDVDLTVTQNGMKQNEDWKTKLYTTDGPNGAPVDYTTVVESTGKDSERQTTTFAPDPKGNVATAVDDYRIDIDGSREMIDSALNGAKKKKFSGINRDYVTQDGTLLKVEDDGAYSAAGGTNVISSRVYCVLKPDSATK
jgi:hypothetical protein